MTLCGSVFWDAQHYRVWRCLRLVKHFLEEATRWAKAEPVRFYISSDRALVWGYSLERREATSGNILLWEFCPFTLRTLMQLVCASFFVRDEDCVRFSRCFGIWFVSQVAIIHTAPWSNLGISDWTKSSPAYYSALHLTSPVCLWEHISFCAFYLASTLVYEQIHPKLMALPSALAVLCVYQ